jgi:hypothetical protein
VSGFGQWIEEALRQVVMGDGAWMWPFLEAAATLARERAARLVPIRDSGPPDELRDPQGKWSGGMPERSLNTMSEAIAMSSPSGRMSKVVVVRIDQRAAG